MKFYPQLIIWTYVVLPAICLLILPALVSSIARAQHQRAKLINNVVQTRARTAAKIARARTPRLGQRSWFSNEIRPLKARRNRRDANDGTENLDMPLQKTHWDQQDESMGQLQTMWNMKDFNSMKSDDIVRSNMEDQQLGNEELLGSPRISDNQKAKNNHGGAFFRRNVFDEMLGKSNPMEAEPMQANRAEPAQGLPNKEILGLGNVIDDVIGQEPPREDHSAFERAPEPTFDLLIEKKKRLKNLLFGKLDKEPAHHYPPPNFDSYNANQSPNYYARTNKEEESILPDGTPKTEDHHSFERAPEPTFDLLFEKKKKLKNILFGKFDKEPAHYYPPPPNYYSYNANQSPNYYARSTKEEEPILPDAIPKTEDHHSFERAPEPTFDLLIEKKKKLKNLLFGKFDKEPAHHYPPPPNYYSYNANQAPNYYGRSNNEEESIHPDGIVEREDHNSFERAPEPTFDLLIAKKRRLKHLLFGTPDNEPAHYYPPPSNYYNQYHAAAYPIYIQESGYLGPKQQGPQYPPPPPSNNYHGGNGYERTAEQLEEEPIIGAPVADSADPRTVDLINLKSNLKHKFFGRNTNEEQVKDPHEGHNHQTPEEVLRCELGDDIAKQLDLDYGNPSNDYYQRAVSHVTEINQKLGDLVKAADPIKLIKPHKEVIVEPHVGYVENVPSTEEEKDTSEKSDDYQEKSASPTFGHSFSHSHTFTHNYEPLKNLHPLSYDRPHTGLFGNKAEAHAKSLNFGIGGITNSFSKADSISSGSGKFGQANAHANAEAGSGILHSGAASNAQAQASSGARHGFIHPTYSQAANANALSQNVFEINQPIAQSGAKAQAQANSQTNGWSNPQAIQPINTQSNAQAQATSGAQHGFIHPTQSKANAHAISQNSFENNQPISQSGAQAQAQANSQTNEWSNPQAIQPINTQSNAQAQASSGAQHGFIHPTQSEANAQAISQNSFENHHPNSQSGAQAQAQANSQINEWSNPQVIQPINTQSNAQAQASSGGQHGFVHPTQSEANAQAISQNSFENHHPNSQSGAQAQAQANSQINEWSNPQAIQPINTQSNAQAQATSGAQHGFIHPTQSEANAHAISQNSFGINQPISQSGAQAQANSQNIPVFDGLNGWSNSAANAQAQALSGGSNTFAPSFSNAQANSQAFNAPRSFSGQALSQAEANANAQTRGFGQSNAQANAFSNSQITPTGFGVPSSAQSNAEASSQSGGSFGQSSAQASAMAQAGQQFFQPFGLNQFERASTPDEQVGQPREPFRMPHLHEIPIHDLLHDMETNSEKLTRVDREETDLESSKKDDLSEKIINDTVKTDVEKPKEAVASLRRKRDLNLPILGLPFQHGGLFPTHHDSKQDALGGLNLASNIVQASLNNNPILHENHDGTKGSANPMEFATGIVESSLGGGKVLHAKNDESKSNLTDTPDTNEPEEARSMENTRDLTFKGISSITDLVGSSLRTKNHADNFHDFEVKNDSHVMPNHHNNTENHNTNTTSVEILISNEKIAEPTLSEITEPQSGKDFHKDNDMVSLENPSSSTNLTQEPDKINETVEHVKLPNNSSAVREDGKDDNPTDKLDDAKLGASNPMTHTPKNIEELNWKGLQETTSEGPITNFDNSAKNNKSETFGNHRTSSTPSYSPQAPSVTSSTPSLLHALATTEINQSVLGISPDEVEEIQFSIPDNATTQSNPTTKLDKEPAPTDQIEEVLGSPHTMLAAKHVEDPLAGLEAEMNSLTEEEKKTFIKQEMKLISEIVRESLQNDKDFMKDLSQMAEETNEPEKAKSSTENSLGSPNIIQAFPHARAHEEFIRRRRSAEDNEEFDAILGAHKEKVQNIQNQATDDGDLLMISFIGDSMIKDLEKRRDQTLTDKQNKETKVKRSPLPNFDPNLAPFTRLVNDPNTKIDVPKTMDNIGAIVRHTFESSRAPMYHVRNMLGNTKNTVMSAVQIPPNNLLVPSEYEVVKSSEPNNQLLGGINEKMLISRSGLEHVEPAQDDSFGIADTFQKIGGFVKKSVDSGKNVFIHANDAAADARSAVQSIKESAPKVLIPGQIPVLASRSNFPTIGSSGPNRILLAPQLLDLQENVLGAKPPSDQFVGMGHLMDSVGISKPEQTDSKWDTKVLQPVEMHESKKENIVTELDGTSHMGIIDFRNEKTSAVGDTLDADKDSVLETLEKAKLETGSKTLHELLDKVQQQVQELLIKEHKKTLEEQFETTKIFKEEKALTTPTADPVVGTPHLAVSPEQIFDKSATDLPPEVLKAFTDDLPIINPSAPESIDHESQKPTLSQKPKPSLKEETHSDENVGLALSPDLLKPFMGQASKDNLNNFLEENGDESMETTASKKAKSGQEDEEVTPKVHLNHVANVPQAALNYQIPAGLLLSHTGPKSFDDSKVLKDITSEETEARTSMVVPDSQMRPFMGMLDRADVHSFLNQYNNNLREGEGDLPQGTDSRREEQFHNKEFMFSEGEQDYNIL